MSCLLEKNLDLHDGWESSVVTICVGSDSATRVMLHDRGLFEDIREQYTHTPLKTGRFLELLYHPTPMHASARYEVAQHHLATTQPRDNVWSTSTTPTWNCC